MNYSQHKIAVALLPLLLAIQLTAMGQNVKKMDRKAKRAEFYPGTIKLNSGDIIKGELSFKKENSIVYHKINKEVRPYTANNVVYFTIEVDDKLQKYYSIPYDIFQEGYTPSVFFEVLFEKSGIAILRNIAVKYTPGQASSAGRDPITGATVYNGGDQTSKREGIYIVNRSNGIKSLFARYLNTIDLNITSGILADRNFIGSQKKYERELLKEFFAENSDHMTQYIKDEKLKTKKVDDLIQIMEHYVSIRSE